jgi:hypothetical protein
MTQPRQKNKRSKDLRAMARSQKILMIEEARGQGNDPSKNPKKEYPSH